MILILDNNNNRAIGLHAALTFIGETAQLVDETSLQSFCEKHQQQECMVILGAFTAAKSRGCDQTVSCHSVFINW